MSTSLKLFHSHNASGGCKTFCSVKWRRIAIHGWHRGSAHMDLSEVMVAKVFINAARLINVATRATVSIDAIFKSTLVQWCLSELEAWCSPDCGVGRTDYSPVFLSISSLWSMFSDFETGLEKSPWIFLAKGPKNCTYHSACGCVGFKTFFATRFHDLVLDGSERHLIPVFTNFVCFTA